MYLIEYEIEKNHYNIFHFGLISYSKQMLSLY